MLSFIIPARNEEARLGSTLAAVHGAATAADEPYEIVVADDASTDRTGIIARSHGARVVRVDHRQIAATRNAGARAAQGEILFFVDADTLATAEAVRAGAEAIRAGATAGGCVFRFDTPLPSWARVLFPVGIRCGRWLKLVGGCFLFCSRRSFDAVGGFPEDYDVGEELLFIRAMKRQGRFVVPEPAVVTSGRRLQCIQGWRLLPTILLLMKFIFVRPSHRTMRHMARLAGYGRDAVGPR